MVFSGKYEFFLLRKFLAQSLIDGFQLFLFQLGVLPLILDILLQTSVQEVIHPLKEAGQTELILKAVNEISGLEFAVASPLHDEAESVPTSHDSASGNKYIEAPIIAKSNLCAGVAGGLLDAAKQMILYLLAVLIGQNPAVNEKLQHLLSLSLFRDISCVQVTATDVLSVIRFSLSQSVRAGCQPFQPVSQSMLTALMLGIERFELTKVAGQLDLHENERIARSGGLHFSGIGGFGLHIVDDALEQIALAKLLDGGGLVLNGLPHTKRQFGM